MFGQTVRGEAACFGEAICYRIPLRIQTHMEPRWEADGVFLGKLDLIDEVIVRTTKGIQTNAGRSTIESRDSAHVCRGTVKPAGPQF